MEMETKLQQPYLTHYSLLIEKCCSKIYQKKFDEILKKQFFNTYKLSNHDMGNVILLLQKGVYRYEYIVDLEKFNESSLPEKEDFHRHPNMDDNADADYVHAKRVCKHFKIRNPGDFNDLYVQNHTLLLADVFRSFRNMCLEIYKVDPAHFLSAPRLAWQAALKRSKKK